MIERKAYLVAEAPDKSSPALIGYRVYVECGCAVFCGYRIDNKEAAVASVPCSAAHQNGELRAFDEAFRKSLENPTDRELVEVVNEYLCDAFGVEE